MRGILLSPPLHGLVVSHRDLVLRFKKRGLEFH